MRQRQSGFSGNDERMTKEGLGEKTEERKEEREKRSFLLGRLGDAAGDRIHLAKLVDALPLFLELGELAAGEL